MKKKRKIIFLGTPVPEEMVGSSDVQNVNIADNIAQNAVIKGLHKYYKEDLTVISVSPKNGPYIIDLGYGVEARAIRSNNHNRILYYLSIMKNYTLELNKIVADSKDDDIVIITNGPYIYMALPVMIARWRYGVRWIPFLIGAVEVPGEKFPLNLISKMSIWTSKRADAAITYVANNVIDYMPGKPFVEIVYLINEKMMKVYREYEPTKVEKKFTIAYTGSFTDTYNIDIVIEAIKKTGSKYHWVFAGRGKKVGAIEELASDKKYNVDYLGVVSNIEAAKIQKSSSLLLCPRGGGSSKINQYYSKYAASGKLTEYLCSGVPIIAGDIPSISDGMKQFLVLEKDQTVDQLVQDIDTVARDYTSRHATAKKAQEYAFSYFTSEYQNKKIYDFIESL